MEGYTGEGEPPCIVMTLIATNKTVSIDANFTVTLDGVQPPNTITITRSPDATTNFTSTDVHDRFSRSYADTGKLYKWYMKTVKLHLLHTECKAEKDSDTKSGQFGLSSTSDLLFLRLSY